MRFPLWSISFIFTAFSLYLEKTTFILVLSVNALTAKSYVANETIKVIIMDFILALKNAMLASKLKIIIY